MFNVTLIMVITTRKTKFTNESASVGTFSITYELLYSNLYL